MKSWLLGLQDRNSADAIGTAPILVCHQNIPSARLCVSPAGGFLQPWKHARLPCCTNLKCLEVGAPRSSSQPITHRNWSCGVTQQCSVCLTDIPRRIEPQLPTAATCSLMYPILLSLTSPFPTSTPGITSQIIYLHTNPGF